MNKLEIMDKRFFVEYDAYYLVKVVRQAPINKPNVVKPEMYQALEIREYKLPGSKQWFE